MTEEDILLQWEVDQVITPNIADESRRIPVLLTKYWRLRRTARSILRAAEAELAELRKEKMTFYSEGPSKEQAKDAKTGKGKYANWMRNAPAKGATQSKAELQVYLDADPDYAAKLLDVASKNDTVETLDEIIKHITNRSFLFREINEYEKQKNGG